MESTTAFFPRCAVPARAIPARALKLSRPPPCSVTVNKIILVAAAMTALASARLAPAADPKEYETVKQLIFSRDAEFWAAYNACDTSHYGRYFTPDVEFYHDRGGLTVGVEALTESIRKNLCGGPNPRLRREAIPETARLSLLANGAEIYGAVLSGEHLFYAIEPNQAPRLDSRARYVHLWLKRDGEFKMARVLSYDHASGSSPSPAATASLSVAQLNACVGKYLAQKSGEISVTREGDHLALDVGGKHRPIYPINETTFTLRERDATFEFHLTPGTPNKLTVRENGAIVDEAALVQ